ncbi:MAG TPA: pyridoxal phosphate-dependent aminotransferase [Candidatus Hydrogenedentes bacterium]|nr:pyridoxal phosphate-dependent aminotransferase [Candidatus Hydrogenedentota bacterium]HQM48427.1 pyridoxal phosphate-dependent aminotransferase [Candidatus Hydrogenedentota bacterium]
MSDIREVDIARGEPDFHTPDHIKLAAHRAIDQNFTKYTPQPGIRELREAIAAKFEAENGFHAEPDDIVVSCGGKHSVAQAIRCVLGSGDEALLVTPHWSMYPGQVKLAGGRPVLVKASEERGFVPAIAAIREGITGRTRLIILNSPANPTGAVYPRALLEQVAELALEKNLYVLSDEVYEHIVFDGAEHVSIASLDKEIAQRTITVNSVSKTHAMTGWRIGYAAFPKGLAARATDIQLHSTSAPCAVSQRAALAALTGDSSHIAMMLAAYVQRRALVLERIGRLPGLSMNPPLGTFYAFVNIRGLIGGDIRGRRLDNADAFTALLQKEARVRVLSGTPFGADSHVRLSFAVSYADLEEGLRRTASLLEEGV